jgi:hypothetical protein
MYLALIYGVCTISRSYIGMHRLMSLGRRSETKQPIPQDNLHELKI